MTFKDASTIRRDGMIWIAFNIPWWEYCLNVWFDFMDDALYGMVYLYRMVRFKLTGRMWYE